MASQLWQRIRAARKYGDLRQQDVAEACGVSRPAVAQWEYEDETRRTRPSIDQMKALAKRSGVPFDWLLNDSANLEDVWQYAKVSAKQIPEPVRQEVPDNSFVKDIIDELVKMQFYKAIPGFYRTIGESNTSVRADFVLDNHIFEFKNRFSMDAVALLLMVEKALGTQATKVLMVREEIPEAQADQIEKTFGVTVLPVTSAWDAADYIHSYLA